MTDPVPTPAPDTPQASPPGAGRFSSLAAFAVFGLLAVVVALAVWRGSRPPPVEAERAEHSALQLDLGKPDALIESASLVRLPRDLLRVPVLRDLLTEDFVFYYEANADRLGLAGALRRIAYEHDLELRDTLIHELLDEPAEIALWRGRDGRLGHALLRLRRGALAKTLQPLLQVAADDTQLRTIGELTVDGDAVAVYRLRYGYDRAIVFASYGDELVVLSSPQMLQADSDAASPLGRIEAAHLQRLLAGDASFAPQFGLDRREVTHRITVNTNTLSLGYGRFVPQLAGLRLDMDDAGWHTAIELNGGGLDAARFAPLWQAMPMGPSACAAVPVSLDALKPLLERLAGASMLPATLAARLDGAAAVCWYAKSRLHTPLLVGRLRAADGDADADLGAAFEQMVGTHEPAMPDGSLPVEQSTNAAGTTWQRNVASRFGLRTSADLPDGQSITGNRFFRVALARHGDTVLFSLDDTLVTQAIATLDRQFPPLSDTLPKQRWVSAYLAPSGLATLIEQEALSALPPDTEAVFRNAAENHLLPKLRAMGTHANVAITLPPDAKAGRDWTWLPVEWATL